MLKEMDVLVLLAVPHKHLYVLYYAWMFSSPKITNRLVPQFLQAWNGDCNIASTGWLYFVLLLWKTIRN